MTVVFADQEPIALQTVAEAAPSAMAALHAIARGPNGYLLDLHLIDHLRLASGQTTAIQAIRAALRSVELGEPAPPLSDDARLRLGLMTTSRWGAKIDHLKGHPGFFARCAEDGVATMLVEAKAARLLAETRQRFWRNIEKMAAAIGHHSIK